MRRRHSGAVASVAAFALLGPLAGCGSSLGSGGDALHLVAAEYGDSPATSSRSYWDKVTKDFAARTGLEVEVTLHPWEDVDREVTRMVNAGEAPDMALMGAYSDFAAQGRLYEASDLLTVSAEANFLPPLAEAGSVGNKLYGLPFVASTRLLFYNEALFEKAGATAPETWSELKRTAEALKADGVPTPYALPLGPEEAHAEAMIWELSNGGGYADGSGGYSIASEQNVQTLRWIKDKLVTPGLTGPVAPSKLNRKDAFAAFLRGEVGMLNGYPSLAHEAKARGIRVGTVAMPVADWMEDGSEPPTMGVADWMMAFKENGRREDIGKFLDFVYQDKNLSDFAGRYHLLPSTTSAARTPAGGGLDDSDEQFLAALRTAQLYPVSKPSWLQVSDTIKRNVGRAVEPGGDPKTVLDEIAERARGLAAKN
ncbi:extracellular solute-binding protein [Streptomyces bambusae]|uniref:extracellular solute-binding protein n=1 Tax=Streptomyces bambusae TaxID=1550616 RepID=UPI001CFF7E90|nr:extracellular solute-binding protein [Streptomyces bambusae]MCB5169811.1 extracellular solute-binding protein [Streptomyces bambusae]